jgi:hypothetical protein
MGAIIVDQKEAAAVLRVQERTLEAWRQRGVGPQFLRYQTGKRGVVRYKMSDLVAYIESSAVQNSAECR